MVSVSIFSCALVAFVAAVATGCPVGCPGLPPCGLAPPACPPGTAPVFPVLLDNCGPNPSLLPILNAPHQQLPCIQKPAIALPACIPAPKTVSNIANCLKTIVKPQIFQQLISQPSLQSYIETTHTPVLEHIHYHGVPINCPPIAPPCLPAFLPAPPCLPACLPAPPCLPAFLPAPPCLPACLPAPPCLPAFLPAPPCLPACLPAPPCLPACLPAPPCLPACLPPFPLC